MLNDNQITFLAETDARNKRLRFGIKAKDRTRHVYVIGKTGMGKSTLLENMAIQDIQNGNGMAFIDPHGSAVDKLMEYVPEHRIKDILYFAPFDLEFPVSFNVMEDVGYDKRHLVASGLMSSFKKIWVDAWSARMEYILNNILLALLEYPDATLIGVNRMLADKDYRKKVVDNITDPAVKAFWNDEFAKYGERYMQEAGAAIQNKIGQFISNPLIRNIIGQPKSTFDIRELMDNRKIMLINLSKGRIGEANANLLGGMLITKIYLAAMSRADVSSDDMKNLPNFYLFVDEFQNFANESFADILSEARKYKLNLTVAHQYIEQMTDEVRAAVFGNVGSMISFRVGSYDAEVLEKEFSPQFLKEDIVNLGFAQIYLRLMIDGVGSQPFSGVTLPPIPRPQQMYIREIVESSRITYAQPRAKVEEDIKNWHTATQKESQPKERQVGGGSAPTSKNSFQSFPPREVRENRPQERQEKGDRPQQKNDRSQPTFPKQEKKSHQPFKVAFENPVKEKENSDRELALRQAVTNNFIKQSNDEKEAQEQKKVQAQIKNDKKGPTQESLGELRSALKDLLKESGVVLSQPAIQQNQSSAPKPTQQGNVIKKEEASDSSVQQVQTMHVSEKSVQETSKMAKQEPERPKEIPESDLRKMLEIE